MFLGENWQEKRSAIPAVVVIVIINMRAHLNQPSEYVVLLSTHTGFSSLTFEKSE